jgi:coenzyme PQQ synthesis protein D (PqqD)
MNELRLRTEKLEWVETDGEVVALDETELAYLSANASGSLLWEELAHGATHEHLINRLVDVFGIDADTAERDVDAFLADLEQRNLLAK